MMGVFTLPNPLRAKVLRLVGQFHFATTWHVDVLTGHDRHQGQLPEQ
jgi:hypothetical protein